MIQGDLVHIPQDVNLFDRNNIHLEKTVKPIVGVFLRETPIGAAWQAGTYTIYALGRETVVEKRDVYPMERIC